MIRKISILLFFFILAPLSLHAGDFKFIYFSSGGLPEMATQEKIVVEGRAVTVHRDAKQLGEGPEKRKSTQTYPVTEKQLNKLIQIVKTSGFMKWPTTAEGSHPSHADEYMEITLDGKTARHSKWETAHEEDFRILYSNFNRWFTDIRSVRF